MHGTLPLQWYFVAADVTVCELCSVEFHCRPRLLKHLAYSMWCMEALLVAREPLSGEQVREAEAADARARRAARSAGVPVITALLPSCKL